MTVSNRVPDLDGSGQGARSVTVRRTDDTLMDGAVTVFAEHGFDRATMEELAAAAGASKPTLYSRFGDKERLFQSCVRRESERLRDWMLESYRQARDSGLREHADATTRALFDYAARHGRGFLLLYGAANRPYARELRDEAMSAVRAEIAALIRAEQAPRDTGGASAEFCASVVADIAVRGVIQAVEQDLDFTAATELTVSMIVGALRHLDPIAAGKLDSLAPSAASARVPADPYPPLTVAHSTPGPRPSGRPPAATAEQVLDTTIRYFRSEDRFEAGAVATHLGIGRTTLYRWFGSREGLLGAAFAHRFQLLVTRADHRCGSRGAHRIAEVLDAAAGAIATDPALRRFLDNEPGSALRLITRADGPVHPATVAVIAALLDRARDHDGYRPPIETTALAYALARVGEAFLYEGTAGDIDDDLRDLRQITRTLLGIG
ncbi:QsdR family transcriptional regulator [Nocardia sp. NPDC048505]|uniref:QsdR family transcriptional regulator n=1 Tax=unclassified Nocardia TaxID=2637762 RepID=UPI00340C6126